MDCETEKIRIGRYLDGMTAPDESDAIEAHLRSCRACAGLRAEVELLGRLHRGLGHLALPAGMNGRIMDAARKIDERRGLARAALAAAAAAFVMLLGVGAGSLIVSSQFPAGPEERCAVYTGLEYFDVHPPGSIGEAIRLAARGETDE